MRLGALFSGGKDSTYAAWKASEKEDVVCLITLFSENVESYLFHTPNIGMTSLQAEAMNLPLVQEWTKGEKEAEVLDLRRAVARAQREYGIEGIVTGAVESVYQAERIQRICRDLDVWCFNPLWLKDQRELLEEVVEHAFSVVISGVFAYPFDETWLGRFLTGETIEELMVLKEKHGISPSGEGGEIETTVLDAPFFEKRIHVTDFRTRMDKNSGVYEIRKAELVEK